MAEIHWKQRYVRLESCPYCGAHEFSRVSEIDSRGVPAEVVICEVCDGCFKAAVLDSEAHVYYYQMLSYTLRGKPVTDSGMEALFHERVRTIAYPRYAFVRHFTDLEPGRDLIVEWGCNDGASLYPWHRAGFEVLGIDLDARAVELGRGKGLPLYYGDLFGQTQSQPAGLLILSHVLEHVLNLQAVLSRAYTLLRPGGFLFVEVPGIRTQALGDPLQYLDAEHNYNFDARTLRALLRRHGFHLLYLDEYVRAIATTEGGLRLPQPRPMPWSAQRIVASVLGWSLQVLTRRPRRLYQVLSDAESRTLRSRLESRMWNLYFRWHYASISGVGEIGDQHAA